MMDCKRRARGDRRRHGRRREAPAREGDRPGRKARRARHGRGHHRDLRPRAAARSRAMVEIGCETDFVARNDNFRAFARKVALQIARRPRPAVRVRGARSPTTFKAGELEIFRAKAAAEGKPEKMLDQISEGMWKKSLTDVRAPEPAVDHAARTTARRSRRCGPSSPARSGENIEIKRFARFEVGAE